jgi:hypothetical protein
LWRLALAQVPIQASGLFVLPVAVLITVPLGFAYAFYQNAAVLALDGSGEALDAAALRREALAQARLWPAQNHLGLAVLWFFGLVVFVNVLVVILALPWLLKTLLGIETMFTRSLWSMFNTTLFATAAAIAYACVDPICKAFYVLRCFHGRSLATGEDLQVELRVLSGAQVRTMAAMMLLFFVTIAAGAEPPSSSPWLGERPAKIDQSITSVLARPEFAWRVPRGALRAEDEGPLGNFLEGIWKMMVRWMQPLKRWVAAFFRWLAEQMSHRDKEPDPGGRAGWEQSLRFFAWTFCALAADALGVLGWKLWQRRRPPSEMAAEPLQILPDLTADEVAADQLPEDAWLVLARDLIARGDLRLALRALYLAVLAHLGERQIISIARHKSNLEYQRELRRRRPAQADLIRAFAETVGSFERAWYGMHEVSRDIIEASQANLETIRQC